jgi:hypothetical protein
MKKIRLAKIVHENRGHRHRTIRFDVQRFGETYFEKIIFRPKKILVRPKTCLSEFWRSDCHESVTHLHEFTLRQ